MNKFAIKSREKSFKKEIDWFDIDEKDRKMLSADAVRIAKKSKSGKYVTSVEYFDDNGAMTKNTADMPHLFYNESNLKGTEFLDVRINIMNALNNAGYITDRTDFCVYILGVRPDKHSKGDHIYNNAIKLLKESGVIRLPSSVNIYKALTETGIEIDKVSFTLLDEVNQIRVADETLTSMMKFITDKYNSIDFSEIEKSAGDYKKFRYIGMIQENLDMLRNVYKTSEEPGAKNYLEVINACFTVHDHLLSSSQTYTVLYKQGNGLVQLMYTSLVASVIYAVGTLVSNTIRFVTSEKDTECEVLFDEIPGSIKHVHIKNVMAAANNIADFDKVLAEFAKPSNRNMSEAALTAALVLKIATPFIILYMLPKLLYLIREIIYAVYFTRIRVSDMLGMQADLVRTNIESLESRQGDKKVIARQKSIAQKLEKWKNKIAVKMDTVEQLKNIQTKKENNSMKIDKNSPIMNYPDPENSGAGLLI